MRLFDLVVIVAFAASGYYIFTEREMMLARIQWAERSLDRQSQRIQVLEQGLSAQERRAEGFRADLTRISQSFEQQGRELRRLTDLLGPISRISRTSSGVIIVE